VDSALPVRKIQTKLELWFSRGSPKTKPKQTSEETRPYKKGKIEKGKVIPHLINNALKGGDIMMTKTKRMAITTKMMKLH
jgi:hypothetical protein